MKTQFLVAFALCAAICSCGRHSGWTPAERAIITGPIPLRVLTIYSEEDSLVLRTPCADLTADELSSPEFAQLSEALLATVTDPSQDGVGIAAPQVGLLRRVIAVQRFDKPGEPFEVYANARVVGCRGGKEPGPEGCLSIPGWRGDVLRYRDIDLQYSVPGASGLRDTVERVQGFTAVIFQHECDHLDGVLYIDKTVPGSLREDQR